MLSYHNYKKINENFGLMNLGVKSKPATALISTNPLMGNVGNPNDMDDDMDDVDDMDDMDDMDDDDNDMDNVDDRDDMDDDNDDDDLSDFDSLHTDEEKGDDHLMNLAGINKPSLSDEDDDLNFEDDDVEDDMEGEEMDFEDFADDEEEEEEEDFDDEEEEDFDDEEEDFDDEEEKMPFESRKHMCSGLDDKKKKHMKKCCNEGRKIAEDAIIPPSDPNSSISAPAPGAVGFAPQQRIGGDNVDFYGFTELPTFEEYYKRCQGKKLED